MESFERFNDQKWRVFLVCTFIANKHTNTKNETWQLTSINALAFRLSEDDLDSPEVKN